MDQLKELMLILDKAAELVDGERIVKVQVLIDLIKSRKIMVATFPDGPPDGG